ncbi:hypothetical protein TNCV_1689591 [Trichonephila clavipes]|nr:hypothetical protein TNCV_1689591 [Trichonephila clavipes]
MTSQYFRCHRLKHYRLLLRSYDRETSKDIELGPLLRALRKVKICKGGKPSIPLRMVVLCTDKRVCIPREISDERSGRITCWTLRNSKMKAIARSFVY